jgi:eukaryotic-like serine/threonine-protein kinase
VVAGNAGSFVGARAGDVLAGKYRIERVLGMGGMGIVVAAQHLQLETKVAIKFLLPHMLEIPDAVTRFLREARAAARIANEHVARVIDVGTAEDTGAPYLVMEFLQGTDLAGHLQQHGPMPIPQAVELVLQACEAVAEAHALGIVHRDLKPANLFLVRRPDGLPSIKVLDFGISKVAGTGMSSGLAVTKTATMVGTVHYMSPEQMTSARDVDPRTDIWAFGVIVHQLLANDLPFAGDTIPEVCINVAMRPPAPLRKQRPDAPAELEAVVGRCLEKDRERRYRNVSELAVALAPFAPERARVSVDRIVRIASSVGVESTRFAAEGFHESAIGRSWPPMQTISPIGKTNDVPPFRKSPLGRLVGVAAGVALVGAGIGAVLVLTGKRTDGHPDPSPSAAAAASGRSIAGPAEPLPAVGLPPAAVLPPQAVRPPQVVLPPPRASEPEPAEEAGFVAPSDGRPAPTARTTAPRGPKPPKTGAVATATPTPTASATAPAATAPPAKTSSVWDDRQ